MHEGGLIRDLVHKIKSVAKDSGAERVTAVKVKLGALAHCSPEHFTEHFVEESKGTVAEGARLNIEVLPEDINDPNAQEIVLESIDVE
ncbi:hydrogenase nickel incorporation protein HypA [bacterium J17]|nr:hydrogenase nickel incorporation protein HypA [bacterium J17]